MGVERFCKYCNKRFEVPPCRVRAGRGKFCCRRCYEKWQAETLIGERSRHWKGGKIARTCEVCGTGFEVYIGVINRGNGRFCSHKCKGQWQSVAYSGEGGPAWKGGKPERQCEQCGKTFYRHTGRFCSVECYNKWQSENGRGKNNPMWKGGQVPRVCGWCEQTFFVDHYVVRSGKGIFCSNVCYGKWQSENRRGENNASWRGGVSFEEYTENFSDEFKQEIRSRDGHTCAICRMKGKIVHHINYIKRDTTPENCIVLCRPCHGVTNGNREYWICALSALIDIRLRQVGNYGNTI